MMKFLSKISEENYSVLEKEIFKDSSNYRKNGGLVSDNLVNQTISSIKLGPI